MWKVLEARESLACWKDTEMSGMAGVESRAMQQGVKREEADASGKVDQDLPSQGLE